MEKFIQLKVREFKYLFFGSSKCTKEIYVQFYSVLGHTKALTDFFLTHLLGIEFDDLSYFTHTDRFIRHDFLSLLMQIKYNISN